MGLLKYFFQLYKLPLQINDYIAFSVYVLSLRDFMMPLHVWLLCLCFTRRLLQRFMPIAQTSTTFSVLTFQIFNYRWLEPDLLQELRIWNFKERQWIFKDIYYVSIHKVPSIFNLLLRSWVTSLYVMTTTLILSSMCSKLPFLWALWQNENSSVFFQSQFCQLLCYYWFLFMCKNSYALCLHKMLHANQIIKWKIISVSEPPRQILKYKTTFRVNQSSFLKLLFSFLWEPLCAGLTTQ